MAAYTKDELLTACDAALDRCAPFSDTDLSELAGALKSRLQAEAPEDARQGVHEVCDKCGLDLRKATTECPSWHGLDLPCDYHRTSQAEAQAPAVLTDATPFGSANADRIERVEFLKRNIGDWSEADADEVCDYALQALKALTPLTPGEQWEVTNARTRIWIGSLDKACANRLVATIDRLSPPSTPGNV